MGVMYRVGNFLDTDSVQRKAEFKNWPPQQRGKAFREYKAHCIVIGA